MQKKILLTRAFVLAASFGLLGGCPAKPVGKTTVASPDALESGVDMEVFKEQLEIPNKEFRVAIYVVPDSPLDVPELLGRTSLADVKSFAIPENAKWFIQPADKNISDEDLFFILRDVAGSGVGGLSLEGCRNVTNAGLVHLKNMTSLEELSLYSDITDAGFAHVKNMTSLRFLRLIDTQVTEADLRDFRAARPDTAVKILVRMRRDP